MSEKKILVFGQENNTKKKKEVQVVTEKPEAEKNDKKTPKKKEGLVEIIFDELIDKSMDDETNLPGELFNNFAVSAAESIFEKISELGFSFVPKQKEEELEKAIQRYNEFEQSKDKIISLEIAKRIDYVLGILTEIVQASEPVTDEDIMNFKLVPKGDKKELYENIEKNDNRIILNKDRNFNLKNILATFSNIVLGVRIAASFDDEGEILKGFTMYTPDIPKLPKQFQIDQIESIVDSIDIAKTKKEDIIEIIKEALENARSD